MAKPKPAKKISLAGRTHKDKVRPGWEDATPERLRHARADAAATIDGQGVRRIAEPFDLLRTRHLLDRSDAALNDMLWQAGDRLRTHWHRAMLDGLSALDPSRAIVDGGSGGPGALNPTEAALRHREHWHRAIDHIGARLTPYAEGIVVAAQSVSALRRLVGDTAHARTADALVLERLREAMYRLADLWRMQPPRRPLPIQSWRPPPDPSPASDQETGGS